MKKIYVLPSCSIVDITLSSLIAASQFDSTASGDQTIKPDENEPEPGEFTSRRRNVWSEEEEDF